MSQLSIDFSIHVLENSKANEAILNSQRKRLSNNCKVLYEALMRGEKLTGATIISKYGMLEYRRRIADLREAGISIQETILSNGCKMWWI